MARDLYVGVMSGTSADGVDACLVAIDRDGIRLRGHVHRPYPEALRRDALEAADGGDLHAVSELDVRLADAYAAAVEALLVECDAERARVRAIGCHGQTVLHRPDGPYPTSIQAGDPHRLAVHAGIDVVADFRRADIAAGGQGAPLAPGFHAAAFASPDEPRAVVNVGGMANVSLLAADASAVTGFDTGPGNVLLDHWTERHRGESYDRAGRWAASGNVDADLLSRLLTDPYFGQVPPKSTGREYFNAQWLENRLDPAAHEPADVQATLAELTACSVSRALEEHAPATTRVLVCGGGAYNEDLMRRLRVAMPERHVESTTAFGIAPECVEPMAFAWLAYRRIRGLPGNRPEVTGARASVCLGALVRAPGGATTAAG